MSETFRTLDTFRQIIGQRNCLFYTLLHFEISSLARWRLIISPKGEKISFKSASSISLNKNENFVKKDKINSVSGPSASSEIKISKINFQEFSTGVKSQKPGLVRRLTGRVQLHLTRSKIGPNLAQQEITFHRLGGSSHLYDKDGEFVFKRKPIRKFTRKNKNFMDFYSLAGYHWYRAPGNALIQRLLNRLSSNMAALVSDGQLL